MDLDACIYSIKGVAILDNDGNRILARYYDDSLPTLREQRAFEKNLFAKTHKANSEIVLLDGFVCVYRSNVDLFFYVMGGTEHNELMLVSALNCLYETISSITRKLVERKSLLDNMDAVLLALVPVLDLGKCPVMCQMSRKVTKVMKNARAFYMVWDCPLDELTDGGIVLEADDRALANRLARPQGEDFSLSDQSVGQLGSKLFETAKDQFKWSLLK